GLPAACHGRNKDGPAVLGRGGGPGAGGGGPCAAPLPAAPQFLADGGRRRPRAGGGGRRRHGLTLSCIESWHLHPGLISALASRVREAQRQCAGDTDVPVIFTAHSLPVRILEWNDPYPEQLQQTCVQVAAAAKVRAWRFAY